jgi:outer membrane protein
VRVAFAFPALVAALTLTPAANGQPVKLLAAHLAEDSIATAAVAVVKAERPVKLTSEQLLELASQLVLERRFKEAEPLLLALMNDRRFDAEREFLEGLIAVDSGDLKGGEKRFRRLLISQPDQPRYRLELARALYLQGQGQAADYHFKLAERGNLPPDIAQAVAVYRQSIRDRRPFSFSLQFGLAPDTNVNAATGNRTVDIFGLPFELNEAARQRSGTGQLVNTMAAVRLPVGERWSFDIEGSGAFANYKGVAFDDLALGLAVGPSVKLGEARVGLAATGALRWYGGTWVNTLTGGRLSVSYPWQGVGDLSAEVNVRGLDNRVNDEYDGWQLLTAVTLERGLSTSISGSVTLFGRYEPLAAKALSSQEVGVALGAGAELPWGLNAGLSARLSGVWFADQLALFETTRKDMRFDGRLYVGLRSLRLWQFSPAIQYNYTRGLSNIPLYDFDRHRIEFTLSRYF